VADSAVDSCMLRRLGIDPRTTFGRTLSSCFADFRDGSHGDRCVGFP
jgi:hypothetical protein